MEFLRDLLTAILNGRNPSAILGEFASDPSKCGIYGEALARLFIELRALGSDRIPCRIDVANKILHDMSQKESIDTIMNERINVGSRSGRIDVAWRKGETYFVCSCKIGMQIAHAMSDFEILPMLACFTEGDALTNQDGIAIDRKNVRPVLFVAKEEIYTRIKETSRASCTERDVATTVRDIAFLDNLANTIRAKCSADPQDIRACAQQIIGMSDYVPLTLRYHQEFITRQVINIIRKGAHDIVIGAMPRSGKTYIAAALIHRIGMTNALIITTRPTETRQQWKNVFMAHIEFANWNIRDFDSNDAPAKMTIAIASAQYMKLHASELANCTPDIIIVDEIHAGGCTELMDELFAQLRAPLRIMLTATYLKPVMHFEIPDAQCVFWDLEDMKLMRDCAPEAAIARLCEKYGDCTQQVALTDDAKRIYRTLPQLQIMTCAMHPPKLSTSGIYGYSNRSLFAISPDGKTFQNADDVGAFLAYISGSQKERDFPRGDMSILARIKREHSRLNHRDGDPFMTQMWFLPYGIGQRICHVKDCMRASIKRDRILSRFDVMQLDAGDGDISKVIHKRVGNARSRGKAGLIILTGDVGSLGISLPDVDITFLLNDIESPDMVYQQMMRVLTEDTGKKCGIVVDFNIFRIMNVISTYIAQRCGHGAMTKRERLTWCISHLIPIDSDMWNCENTPVMASREDIIQSLINRWNETIKDTNRIVEKLHAEQIDLGEDQRILNGVYLKNRITRARDDADDSEPNPGLEIRHDEPATSASAREVDKPGERINLNHVIAVLLYDIILMVRINADLLNSLEWIAQNAEEHADLDYQAALLFPKIQMEIDGKAIGVLDTIIYLIRKHYAELVSAREIFDMVRGRLANLIDNPAAMIAFLSKHLHPSEVEKKLMGEVFTPPELINEMLDKLGETCPNIWSDPTRKFLDPAAGYGNFPAFIYQRLMAGLANAIPDEDIRSRHIQEKMLFMCELNPKNAKIAKRLFAKCPNIFCEDFLARDYGDAKFDVIVGNPPYNAPSVSGRATGNTLYPKFLIKCETLLKENGYQVMVHPGIWRKPGNKLHDCMFGRQIHYLEIHTDSEGQKLFGATTRYEWYVLQNKSPITETTIRFDDGRIEKYILNAKIPFLPNHGLSIVEKVRAKLTQDNKMCVHCAGGATSSKCVETPDKIYKFPLINSTSQSRGSVVKYSSREHPKQHDKKVIFANNRFVIPFYDNGYYGVTQHGLFQNVINHDEGARLCVYLRSRIIQYVVAACKWSMFQTEYEMFEHIPFPRELTRNDIADEGKLYAYFGLSKDEIARIEAKARVFGEYNEVLPDPRGQIAQLIGTSKDDAVEEQEEEQIEEPEDEYAKLTLAALREKCRALGIRGRSKMKRDEMIAAIKGKSE